MSERGRYRWHPWGSRARAEGDLALGSGDLAGAERWYRQAAEEDDPAAVLELARLAAARGDQASTRQWVRRFRDLGGPMDAVAGLPGMR
jgi:hypothetical protein